MLKPIRSESSIRHDVPILSVSIEVQNGSRQLERENDMCMEFQCKVTYHGVDTTINSPAGPLTFFTGIFHDEINYKLERLVEGSSKNWTPCRYGVGYCGGFLSDEPAKLHVDRSENFVCLRPGEAWEGRFGLDDQLWEFPDHLRAGTTFRFSFKGAAIEWWDWGTKDETHANTILTFRGPAQSVTPDSDFPDENNGGRPQIIIPPSNEVELVLAG